MRFIDYEEFAAEILSAAAHSQSRRTGTTGLVRLGSFSFGELAFDSRRMDGFRYAQEP
jgi:hypothetical protein